ncbi:Sterile alpha motif/pointed domain [Phytophthora cactorum]|nr:Sterile alpha motif/pointed domain [Phytophthora cactorum]
MKVFKFELTRPSYSAGTAASAATDALTLRLRFFFLYGPASSAPPSECDECEQRTAQVNCDDCGLVYCSQCDVHRHRKGKLQLHQRVQITRKRFEAPELEEILEEAGNSTANWKNYDVCEWLEAHDLKLFVEEAQVQKITGATLLSSEGLEKFLDAATGSVVATRRSCRGKCKNSRVW